MSKEPTGSTKDCVEFTRAMVAARKELEGNAAHQRIIKLWDELRAKLYGKLAGEDAFQAFARENGLVQLAMQQHGGDAIAMEGVLVELARALEHAERSDEFEACLDEAERLTDSATRRSYQRGLKELRDKLCADSENGNELGNGKHVKDRGKPLNELYPDVYKQDGKQKKPVMDILSVLPQPSWAMIAKKLVKDEVYLRQYSKPMQEAGLMKKTDDGYFKITDKKLTT